MEQTGDVTTLADRRLLAVRPVRRRPSDQPVAEDGGRHSATTIVVIVAAMAFDVDVEQARPVRGGPVADDPDVEQLLHDVIAPFAPGLAAFAHRPASDVRTLDDEIAEPGRPRAVDRGEQPSGRLRRSAAG